MKRVYCLYRVSTKKQVDKNENDIPMQKNACHDFVIRQNDWSILKEFSEKGVSGYKVSAPVSYTHLFKGKLPSLQILSLRQKIILLNGPHICKHIFISYMAVSYTHLNRRYPYGWIPTMRHSILSSRILGNQLPKNSSVFLIRPCAYIHMKCARRQRY